MTMEQQSRMVSGARELVGHEVLVVSVDDHVQRALLGVLAPAGLHLSTSQDEARALELVATKFFCAVVVDLDDAPAGAGLALVDAVHERSPLSTVIILTGRQDFTEAVAAFRRGASDVIGKAPSDLEYLKERILEAAGTARQRGGREELIGAVRESLEEFLRVLMTESRRAQELEDKLSGRPADAGASDEEVRILCVDGDDRLYKGMQQQNVPGFSFVYAQSGGEALDRITSSRFHMALVGPSIQDLPTDMVVRSLRAQAPGLIMITYVPGGPLVIIESTRTIQLVDKFTRAAHLVERLTELAQAHRARAKERRYLQAFREKHYEFLRKLAELRQRVEKAR